MPGQLDRIKIILKESGLEVHENFQRIIHHLSFSYLGSAIEDLHEIGLLNEKSLNLLIKNKNPLLISDSIRMLDKANLYNAESLEIVLNFAESVEILSNGGIEIQEEIAFVFKHQCPVEAAYALVNLKAAGLLNEKFKAAIVNDKDADSAIPIINWFAEQKILTESRFDSALQCTYPTRVANIIACIDEVGALSEATETAIFKHRGMDIIHLEIIIENLKRQQLLTAEVIKKILECRYLSLSEQQDIGTISAYGEQHALNFLRMNIEELSAAEILNENNVHRLITAVNQCSDDTQANMIFNRYFAFIPPHVWNQNVFDGFIESCEGGQDAINIYLRNLGIDFGDFVFNGQQSTHTGSVEESVSIVALALKKRYSEQLAKEGVGAVLNRIDNHLLLETLAKNTELEPYKIEAALTYLKDIRSQIGNPFYDSRSNVSLPEVVALARLAIEDEKERIGSFNDAFKASAQGYYEAQREYNLDSDGQEKVNEFGNSMPDMPACREGQFNKSINLLQGHYTNADIVYATTQTATNKLQALIKQNVFDCLEYELVGTSLQGLSAHINNLLATKELEEKLNETKHTIFQALWGEFSNFSGVFGNSTELVDKLNTCQAMVDVGYDAVDLSAITQEYIKKTIEKKNEFSDPSSDCKKDTKESQATEITQVGFFRQSTSGSTCLAEEDRSFENKI